MYVSDCNMIESFYSFEWCLFELLLFILNSSTTKKDNFMIFCDPTVVKPIIDL